MSDSPPTETREHAPMSSEGIGSEIAYLRQQVRELRDEAAKHRSTARRWREKYESVEGEYKAKLTEREHEIEELRTNLGELTEAFDEVFDNEGNLKPEFVEEIHGEYAETLQALQAERDELAQQLEADPDGLRGTIKEQTAKLRQIEHEKAWSKALNGELHEKADLQKLWSLIGYHPDADEVDEAEIQEQVKAAREAVPFLFRASAPVADESAPGGPGGAKQAATQQAPAPPKAFDRGLSGGRGAPVTGGASMTVSKRDLSDPAFMQANQSAIAQHGRDGTLVMTD